MAVDVREEPKVPWTRLKWEPPPPVTPADVGRAIRRMRHLDQLEGFGVFGSLGGQQGRKFDPEHSDIDVFIVLKDAYFTNENIDRWTYRIMRVVGDRFRRGVDVMVWSLAALRQVPSWHTISMASDCPILYDPGGKVADVFRKIVEAAHAAGLGQITRDDGIRLWHKLNYRLGETFTVEVRDDDE